MNFPKIQLSQPHVFDYSDPNHEKLLPSSEIFDQLLQVCKLSNRKYIDLEFPPNFKHLVQEKNSIHTYDWSSFIWCRSDKLYKDPRIFAINLKKSFVKCANAKAIKDISKSDILQGALGNCYFLAALCSLAEISDNLIRRLFLTTEANKNGIYCVQLCFNGEWKAVIIDDNFPCYPDERSPCFTKGNNEELWVMLLEKAWAKLHRNYEKIEAGISSESLRSLTGAPVEVYFKDEPGLDLWNVLKNAYKNGFPMTAGADEEENLSGSKIGKKNLVPSHVYSLLAAVEVNHYSRGLQRLIKMRNPWGNKEWKGDWSDESPLWNEDLLKKLDHNKNADDGTFCIEYKDFIESFSEVAISFYHPDYKYSSLGYKPGKKASYFNLKIDKAGEYYISAVQASKRSSSDDNEDHQYAVVRLLIAKIDTNGQLKFIEAKQKKEQSMHINVKYLETGSYVVYAKVFNQEFNGKAGDNSVFIGVYGVEKTQIKNAIKIKGFVEKVYLFKAQGSKKKLNYKEISRGDVEKAFELFEDEGFGYFYIRNSGAKKFNNKVTFQKKEGLKMRGIKGNSTIVDFDLAPGAEKILTVTVDYHGYSLKYAESLTY